MFRLALDRNKMKRGSSCFYIKSKAIYRSIVIIQAYAEKINKGGMLL